LTSPPAQSTTSTSIAPTTTSTTSELG
jgi:hypothetical protein